MHVRTAAILIALLLPIATFSSAFAQPRVVATIPPIHSLATLVMDGVGSPRLLLTGSESPHKYTLKPSQSRALAESEIVLRIDESFETFMKKPLRALAGRATVVDLLEAPGVKLLKWQDEHDDHDGHQDHDDHKKHGHKDHDDHKEKAHKGHDHHDHDGEHDIHIWLHTENAVALVKAIAGILSEKDAANSVRYKANADRASVRLRSLKRELEGILQPVKNLPFMTFHDAWQYFNAEFGMKYVGAITLTPEKEPGARRITEVRKTIRKSGARCLFSEPQFPAALAKVAVRGTPAKIAVIDPVGVNLSPGSDLYFDLMRQNAKAMISCLGRSGG
ncbi:MAG: zinc ABC transporter substrate-binding protein [Pseudomonadota bacterium]|nr:zinc ABC transporter substrate-binding protein [Pseudomonadota bacterium]